MFKYWLNKQKQFINNFKFIRLNILDCGISKLVWNLKTERLSIKTSNLLVSIKSKIKEDFK